jgi:hypothetical protein
MAATDASSGVARQEKIMHALESPFYHTLSLPTLSPLLAAGKNIVGYFLDRPCTTQKTMLFKNSS